VQPPATLATSRQGDINRFSKLFAGRGLGTECGFASFQGILDLAFGGIDRRTRFRSVSSIQLAKTFE